MLFHRRGLLWLGSAVRYSRIGKGIVKFCHRLQVANFSLLLVQNSLRYVNTINFESILSICLFKTGMFQRIKK